MTDASFLVRHGEAGDRTSWSGNDALRPLTDRGRAQAAWLASELVPFAITQLVSSPYRRCVETLEPLARALKMTIVEDDALAEGEGAARALSLLQRPGTVVCTHGDVVEEWLSAVGRHGLTLSGGPGKRRAPTGSWIRPASATSSRRPSHPLAADRCI